MPKKIPNEPCQFVYTPDLEEIRSRARGSRTAVDGESVLNKLATSCLDCLKLCQSQRPVIQQNKSDKKKVLLSPSFFDQFCRHLVQLENAFSDVAFAYGKTYVQMIKEIAKAEDFDLVQVFVSDDSVLIRLPYLPPRNVTKFHMYADLLAGKLSALQMPSWQRWHAHICQVFSSATIRTARDVDNSDYKRKQAFR